MAPAELSIHTGQSSTRVRRSTSISSDRTSLQGYGGLLSPPAAVSPEPAFIAASAASQIVTNDHDSQAETWFDQHGIEPSGETALVAPPALKLVNRFLDQLLFNFLSVSRSTSLAALRPAVSEVLKAKLARGAINGADQELNEYLGGGDDEELLALHDGFEANGDWDLELIWKRTRLRCMVYSSLGDMEEEDEDYYTEQELLDGPDTQNKYASGPGVVSPAVAIFLTSILEFMGEQVLVVAGQAAYHRLRSKHEKEEREGTSTPADIAERVVVEDFDMERVALDRTLGRLWRGWKKRVRSPTTSVSMARSFSRESLLSEGQTSRATSSSPIAIVEEDARRPSLAAVLAEHEHAANIPLPMGPNDMNEIEIPGLAKNMDDEGQDTEESTDDELYIPKRPKSMMISTQFLSGPLTPTSPEPFTPISFGPISRKRSNSVPSPAPTPYTSPKRANPSVEQPNSAGMVARYINGPDAIEGAEPDADFTGESFEGTGGKSATEGPGVLEVTKSIVTEVLTGVTTLASGAVVGIVAAAKGEAPQTDLVPKEEQEIEEDFTEEVQIMTSARVSLSGRVSPDESQSKNVSRRSSVRSPSVHSLRLIDVGAKSPQRSRQSSVDVDTIGRPAMSSRPSSIQSNGFSDSHTPRVSSPVLRGTNASPLARNPSGSSISVARTRNSAGDSIAEVEEKGLEFQPGSAKEDSNPNTAVPSDFAGAMQGLDPGLARNDSESDTLNRELTQHKSTIPSTFVLAAAPSTRNHRSPLDPPENTLPTQFYSNLTATNLASRALGVEGGVPPLTPLREMMEGATDTSDESSSIAPSNDAPSNDAQSVEKSAHEHSISASSSSLYQAARPTIATQQKPNTTTNVTNIANAPSISRGSPPRPARRDSLRSANADVPSKSQRSLHTSGSGSSVNSHKLKVVRTSEENNPTNGPEFKDQSFEQLIRSDQTIQYTLTPQTMRDIEDPESPRNSLPNNIPNFEGRPHTSRSHSSSLTKLNGLNSNPINPAATSAKSAKTFKAFTRPPTAPAGSKLRPNAPQARDARVDRKSSLVDFAEFIRNTGPVAAPEPAPSIASARTVTAHRGANGSARNASSTVTRVVTATSMPRRSESSAGRSRLQARDAVVPRGDSISDLIDFVRSGPQLDRETHRIPRTIAPFRSTMDSDQMTGAVSGKAVDASLPDPRYSQTSNSINSSVTSQAPLLKNKPLPTQRNDFEEEDMMPKRKTRRVRDPYAIDFSDEEDEFDATMYSRPKPIQEESLADFLRSVPPPPEPVVTSVFQDIPRPATGKRLNKKSSTPSLMSRFGRANSSPNTTSKSKSIPESKPPVAKQYPTHTPIAAQYSTTSYAPQPLPQTFPTGSRPDSAQTSRSKNTQKSYQPREAVYNPASRTSDLADFLMRSEPPSSGQTQPQTFLPTVHKEEASAFQRMFGRKKVAH